MGKKVKDLSRNSNLEVVDGMQPTTETYQLSCLMRIADATELMALNYIQMQNNLDWYKKRYAEMGAEIEQLKLSRAGHKAAFTKLKNKEKTVESESN